MNWIFSKCNQDLCMTFGYEFILQPLQLVVKRLLLSHLTFFVLYDTVSERPLEIAYFPFIVHSLFTHRLFRAIFWRHSMEYCTFPWWWWCVMPTDRKKFYFIVSLFSLHVQSSVAAFFATAFTTQQFRIKF